MHPTVFVFIKKNIIKGLFSLISYETVKPQLQKPLNLNETNKLLNGGLVVDSQEKGPGFKSQSGPTQCSAAIGSASDRSVISVGLENKVDNQNVFRSSLLVNILLQLGAEPF